MLDTVPSPSAVDISSMQAPSESVLIVNVFFIRVDLGPHHAPSALAMASPSSSLDCRRTDPQSYTSSVLMEQIEMKCSIG